MKRRAFLQAAVSFAAACVLPTVPRLEGPDAPADPDMDVVSLIRAYRDDVLDGFREGILRQHQRLYGPVCEPFFTNAEVAEFHRDLPKYTAFLEKTCE